MDSTRVSVSLKGECTTASSNHNKDSTNVVIPHYLCPSSGSCHDICKYGRRRGFEEQPTEPLHKRTPKLSIVLPKPSDTRNNNVQSGKKIWMPIGAPSSPSNRRKTPRTNLLSPRNDQKRVKRVKTDSSIPLSNYASFQEEEEAREIKNSGKEITKTNIESVQSVEEDQTKIETAQTAVTNAPSSSSHGEDVEESDKPPVSQRKRNHTLRRRKNRFVKSGDKHSHPIKLKFRTGNSLYLHEENIVARRHQFKRIRAEESVFENKSIRMRSLKASRTKDKHSLRKEIRRRARYGKARILVLENRKGDSKTKYQENNDIANAELLSRRKNLHHHQDHMQRKKNAQYLFSYVIEESASKLAERRKGMVKSLVGAFESLISLQTRNCFFRVAKMKA